MESEHATIYATHGVIASASQERFTHRNLLDRNKFIQHLRSRPRPYVKLSQSLQGCGDALTIDDSTRTALEAACLARECGHEVTLFLNGYNIVEQQTYFFCRLSAALDSAAKAIIRYEGVDYNFPDPSSKNRFRALVKERLNRFSTDDDRQDYVSEIGALLGLSTIVVPPYLDTITTKDVHYLFHLGVDIQNHGWVHARVGSLSPSLYEDNIRLGREWIYRLLQCESDYFAVPNGDGLPTSKQSPSYKAWFLLERWDVAPTFHNVFPRRALAF